jgi:DNA-binding MarR family transcriptional regulator
MPRWEAMFLVAFSGRGLTQSELARLISVSGPTMVRMLDQLAQEGLIRRFQSDVDARVTTNEITPKGLTAVAQIMDASNQLRREVVQGIEQEKLEVCLDVLDRILRRLDELSFS